MSDADHRKYMKLLESLYLGSRLSDAELTELTRLHYANCERVNKIVTEGATR